MEDLAKKRRKYVLNMVQVQAKRVAGALSTLCCGGLSLLFAYSLGKALVSCIIPGQPYLWWRLDTLTHLAIYSSWTGFFAAVTWLAARSWHCSAKEAKAIRALSGQGGNVPADEVVLRSTDQPVTAPRELLRAARDGNEKNAANELLLRKSVG